MAGQDGRWVEVSKSAFAHETAGLELLRQLVPDASPYRAWTNFEFMDNHGQWHEIDALVLGRRRLHLVVMRLIELPQLCSPKLPTRGRYLL